MALRVIRKQPYYAASGASAHKFWAPDGWYVVSGSVVPDSPSDAGKVFLCQQNTDSSNWQGGSSWEPVFYNTSESDVSVIVEFLVSDEPVQVVSYGGD